MTEEEKELMKRYDITVEQKSVYTYKGYKYEHLKDALNYAKLDAGAALNSSVPKV
jgi:hypothetical protein